jgi:hypothetical protein
MFCSRTWKQSEQIRIAMERKSKRRSHRRHRSHSSGRSNAKMDSSVNRRQAEIRSHDANDLEHQSDYDNYLMPPYNAENEPTNDGNKRKTNPPDYVSVLCNLIHFCHLIIVK